jgi:hypothetical protein
MTLLRTLWVVAALGALPLAGCGGDAFSLAIDAGAGGSGASSGSAKSGSTSGVSTGAASGAATGASSGAASGVASGSSGTSTGSSTGSAAGGSSSGAPDAGGGVVCPASAPNPGSMCPRVGLDCEYGTSPNRVCNQIAQCKATGWIYTSHPACPMGSCAVTYEQTPPGGACNPDGLTCAYPKGTCICSPPAGPVVLRLDGGLVGAQWDCRAATIPCHSPRPNVGMPCSEDTRICDYGGCLTDGIVLQCRSGLWQESAPICPL